jgi:thymidylate synthase (FAD)
MTRIGVLDHGYVELIRVDGCDREVAETARTSTASSGDPAKDTKLVDRLVRDRHTSPVEFVGMVFEIQMPIFIARQWMRHRTGAFNEFSLRYSEAPDIFYVPEPERCQAQSTFNKQGSAEQLDDNAAEIIRECIRTTSENCYEEYRGLLEMGLTRELARMVLPVNFYTKVRWKLDMHNLMHFMKLREDPHAQWEIREYAKVIHLMAKAAFPQLMASFENHIQNQVVLSKEAAAFLVERMVDDYELEQMCLPQSLHSELAELKRRV